MNTQKESVFVAGGTGYMGQHVIRTLVAERPDLRVLAVVRSPRAADRVKALGAEPVRGDMMVPGDWKIPMKDAQYVIHMAQPLVDFTSRISVKDSERYGRDRLKMDEGMLRVLDPEHTKRFVYCSGNTYFGKTGTEPMDEDMTPNPIGFGEYIAKPVNRLDDYIRKGLDLVAVFPAAAYGDGAWLKEFILKPLRAGKKLMKIGKGGKYMSPIYVKDIARAVVFMLSVPKEKLDEVGRKILLVDDKPVTYEELHEQCARLLGKKVKYANIPEGLFRLLAGKNTSSYMTNHTVYSNARLKKLGFKLKYPTIYQGLADFVKP